LFPGPSGWGEQDHSALAARMRGLALRSRDWRLLRFFLPIESLRRRNLFPNNIDFLRAVAVGETALQALPLV